MTTPSGDFLMMTKRSILITIATLAFGLALASNPAFADVLPMPPYPAFEAHAFPPPDDVWRGIVANVWALAALMLCGATFGAWAGTLMLLGQSLPLKRLAGVSCSMEMGLIVPLVHITSSRPFPISEALGGALLSFCLVILPGCCFTLTRLAAVENLPRPRHLRLSLVALASYFLSFAGGMLLANALAFLLAGRPFLALVAAASPMAAPLALWLACYAARRPLSSAQAVRVWLPAGCVVGLVSFMVYAWMTVTFIEAIKEHGDAIYFPPIFSPLALVLFFAEGSNWEGELLALQMGCYAMLFLSLWYRGVYRAFADIRGEAFKLFYASTGLMLLMALLLWGAARGLGYSDGDIHRALDPAWAIFDREWRAVREAWVSPSVRLGGL